MEAGLSPARQARAKHRHELRTLTYVTLDQANGGIVRNLSHEGIGVQAVAALRPQQQLRVRFELRTPRVRVEARGEVTWATFSGQCGIRFLDLSPRMTRQINEWIFGNLLEGSFAACGASRDPCLRTSQDERRADGFSVATEGDSVAGADCIGDRDSAAVELDWLVAAAFGAQFGLDDQYAGDGGGLSVVCVGVFVGDRRTSAMADGDGGRSGDFCGELCIGDFFGCSEERVRGRDWRGWWDVMWEDEATRCAVSVKSVGLRTR